MSKNRTDTKYRILESAIKLFNQTGGNRLTVREIAKKARVNIAAVNYHFDSLEDLTDKVTTRLFEELAQALQVLNTETVSTENRLKTYCLKLLDFTLTYPDMHRNLLGKAAFEQKAAKHEKAMKDYVAFFKEAIKDLTGINDGPGLTFKTAQFLSSLVYPALIGQTGQQALGLSLSDLRGERRIYREHHREPDCELTRIFELLHKIFSVSPVGYFNFTRASLTSYLTTK